MGRLPSDPSDRRVDFIPYSMPGELVIPNSPASGVQFPDATFLFSIDKPFEIHRMIPRITGLDAEGNVVPEQPDQDTLAGLVKLRIVDFSKNENLTKSSAFVRTLVKGSNERTWEWERPYPLERAEGFQILVDTLPIPAFVPAISQLRVEITFQGYLVVTPVDAR